MARKGLGGGDGRDMRGEEASYGAAFTQVVIGCACAVGIDIIDVFGFESSGGQRLLHSEIRPIAIRR